MEPIEMKDIICRELDEHKAVDITVLDVAHLTVLTDYFVICTAKATSKSRLLPNLWTKRCRKTASNLRIRTVWVTANGLFSTTAE